MKLLGLISLMAACAGIGLVESHKLKERTVFLEGFIAFLNYSESHIRYGMCPVQELIFSCRRQLPVLEACAGYLEEGLAFPQAWSRSANEKGGKDSKLIREFGFGLGVTDLEGQLTHIRLYQKLTADRLRQAQDCLEKKGKLYRQLGVLGGISVALVLW